MKTLLLSTVAVSELSGCFECQAALAEADDSLLVMDDSVCVSVDGWRGAPSNTRKREPPSRCMSGRSKPPLSMSASMMAVASLRGFRLDLFIL